MCRPGPWGKEEGKAREEVHCGCRTRALFWLPRNDRRREGQEGEGATRMNVGSTAASAQRRRCSLAARRGTLAMLLLSWSLTLGINPRAEAVKPVERACCPGARACSRQVWSMPPPHAQRLGSGVRAEGEVQLSARECLCCGGSVLGYSAAAVCRVLLQEWQRGDDT